MVHNLTVQELFCQQIGIHKASIYVNVPAFLFHRNLCSVLTEKYGWSTEDSIAMSSFLTPMLDFSPAARTTAYQALQHPWLNS